MNSTTAMWVAIFCQAVALGGVVWGFGVGWGKMQTAMKNLTDRLVKFEAKLEQIDCKGHDTRLTRVEAIINDGRFVRTAAYDQTEVVWQQRFKEFGDAVQRLTLLIASLEQRKSDKE
jgi:hypothetical protein